MCMTHINAIASGDTAAKCCAASVCEVLFEHGKSLWEYRKSEHVYYVHSALLYF